MTTLRETPYSRFFQVALISALLLIAYLAFAPMEQTPLERINDKLAHTAAFACLAFLLDFARPRSRWGIAKLLPLFAYGAAIELVQHFLPYRHFSLLDLAADALGLMLYPLAIPLCKRIPGLALRWNSVTNS